VAGRGDEVSLSLDEFISENGLVRWPLADIWAGMLVTSFGGPIRSEKMDSSNNLTLVQQPDTPNNRARTGTDHYSRVCCFHFWKLWKLVCCSGMKLLSEILQLAWAAISYELSRWSMQVACSDYTQISRRFSFHSALQTFLSRQFDLVSEYFYDV